MRLCFCFCLDLPSEMRITNSGLLSNLSIGSDEQTEFECQTSISNPEATLTITRQSNDGIKHSDIRYESTSNYADGKNSIRFKVSY